MSGRARNKRVKRLSEAIRETIPAFEVMQRHIDDAVLKSLEIQGRGFYKVVAPPTPQMDPTKVCRRNEAQEMMHVLRMVERFKSEMRFMQKGLPSGGSK